VSRKPESEKWILAGLIAFVAVLMVFLPSYGWHLRDYLSPQSHASSADDVSLKAQNEVLLADLAKLQAVTAELPAKPSNYIRAMVFSRYPLNFKNQMLVDAGANQGVKVGAAAVFQGVLVGRVTTVFGDSALVTTVFDTSFKMPVRIGSHGYDGLLAGGPYPSINSISKDALLAPGDIVYAAAEGVPYGLPVGQIDATSTSPDSLFENAALNFAYDANDIQTVFVAQ